MITPEEFAVARRNNPNARIETDPLSGAQTIIVGSAVSASGNGALGRKGAINRIMDDVMVGVINQALKEGISLDDSEEILRRKTVARAAVKKQFYG
ncbi:MAG: hypothetical protein ACREQF_07295 [Candidatus Binataceae bacterium]